MVHVLEQEIPICSILQRRCRIQERFGSVGALRCRQKVVRERGQQEVVGVGHDVVVRRGRAEFGLVVLDVDE